LIDRSIDSLFGSEKASHSQRRVSLSSSHSDFYFYFASV